MTMVILLDAGPLGLVTNPNTSPEFFACNEWLESMLANGSRVLVPEIADYEVRRELFRADKLRGIERLDALGARTGYLSITTQVMRTAAQFWATARKRGRQAASDASLDADVILAAQAVSIATGEDRVVVATANVRHLAHFIDARRWQDIR